MYFPLAHSPVLWYAVTINQRGNSNSISDPEYFGTDILFMSYMKGHYLSFRYVT